MGSSGLDGVLASVPQMPRFLPYERWSWVAECTVDVSYVGYASLGVRLCVIATDAGTLCMGAP